MSKKYGVYCWFKICLPMKQINKFSSEEVPQMLDDSIFTQGKEWKKYETFLALFII